MHDADVQLSLFNVVSACIVALLLTAVIIILVVAYIRTKSKGTLKVYTGGAVLISAQVENK
ncbi:hypothetical protein ANCCAN_10693 [Ancylostoma caninum]|uniref:Uncharacterized protein n=1 Tax=Ancylostoma caninum TaxID=29170 RepID=A0A368GJ93_ANCCA|nr:hypothetical protein ANCCAN_10693 [Ancylostoma caninum]